MAELSTFCVLMFSSELNSLSSFIPAPSPSSYVVGMCGSHCVVLNRALVDVLDPVSASLYHFLECFLTVLRWPVGPKFSGVPVRNKIHPFH